MEIRDISLLIRHYEGIVKVWKEILEKLEKEDKEKQNVNQRSD